MFSIDRRMLYIIIVIFFLLNISTFTPDYLLGLVLTLPGVIIAITFHEFAHAYVADKLGDDTARIQGRLNLNPLSHVDPIGFIMLIVAHFGWGKPVQINPRNFNSKISLSAGEAIVSIAGPIMNFILSIIFTIIAFILMAVAPAFLLTQTGDIVMQIIEYTIIVNVGLGVFNLIPLPPLDGSKVLKHFLPYNGKRWFEEHEMIFYIGFLILWVTGIAGDIISPIIDLICNGLMWVGSRIFLIFM